MSRLGTAALAGGVFVILFGATWVVATQMQGATAARASEPGVQQYDRVVEPNFEEVRNQVARKGGRPLTAERMAARDLDDEEVVAMLAQMTGVRVPVGLVRSARIDGPTSESYVRYAEIDGADGWKTVCVSRFSGEKNWADHMVVRYSATEVDEEGASDASLADYVNSGCAAAVRDHSTQMSLVQFVQRQASLTPKTPKYAARRKEYADDLHRWSSRQR